ncbi:hypothetical protein BDV98DRAFT_348716 [Pterulicium gracile]|uniref:RNase III domain-containing protein n=1 Tax=Pterulicium gracile TaxID=1884261 RepID=A0A5C3QR16_9AGAR|nr:hypothetical protein BDV98DRAFT_348716 [Pterula gracilis]
MVKVKKVYDKSKGLHSLISEVVHGIIPSGNFSFNPPESRTWRDVQQRGNAPEKDRLEYLGDAVMYLGLAHELYRKYPNKTAGFYTVSIHHSRHTGCGHSLLRRASSVSFFLPITERTLCAVDEHNIHAAYEKSRSRPRSDWQDGGGRV